MVMVSAAYFSTWSRFILRKNVRHDKSWHKADITHYVPMHYPSWTIITSDVCIRVPLRHHSLINMTCDVCIRTYQWETYVPSRHICKYSLKYSNFIGYCAFWRVNANKQRVLTRSNFTRFVNRLLAPIAFHTRAASRGVINTITDVWKAVRAKNTWILTRI